MSATVPTATAAPVYNPIPPFVGGGAAGQAAAPAPPVKDEPYTTLFSEKNRVFYEMRVGKIGKDGKLTTQKGQKGITCEYYAMRMLLLTEQIRTPHGHACSLRRKALTALGDVYYGQDKYHTARLKANEAFLKGKGLDPKVEADKFWMNMLKTGLAEIPAEMMTDQFLAMIIAESEPKILQEQPWFRRKLVDGAANSVLWHGYGMKEVCYGDFKTMEGLIKTLQTKGPLMIQGSFGRFFYKGAAAEKMKSMSVGKHALYYWQKGTPTLDEKQISHAIVLVGAEIKDGKSYVYWVDPGDSHDPKDPLSRKIYISTFESIHAKMIPLFGVQLDKVDVKVRNNVAVALYNPKYKPQDPVKDAAAAAGKK